MPPTVVTFASLGVDAKTAPDERKGSTASNFAEKSQFTSSELSVSTLGSRATDPLRLSEFQEDPESLAPAFPQVAWSLVPVSMAIAISRSVREMLLPLRSSDLGLSSSTTGYVVAVSFALDMALVPITGYVMDRYGRKNAGAASLILQGIGFVLLAQSDSLWTLVGAACLLGTGNGFSNGWVQVVGADIAPAGSSATFLGYWSAVMNAGLTMGPLVAGRLSESSGTALASGITGIVAALASLWYVVCAEETLGWEQRQQAERNLL